LLDWDESGLGLLLAMNTPEQKRYLGGPESDEKLLDRHARYLTYRTPGDTEMVRIVVDGETVGSVGYWPIVRHGEAAYETGWELLAAHHGKGYGSAAARMLLERLLPVARHRYVYAFPTPENAGSNGICRKLGFALLATENVEYPKGVWSPHNILRLDLGGWRGRSA
jgi:RimJ/RimL family protein N-acetyltransferase